MSLADIATNNEQKEDSDNPENIKRLNLAGERFKELVLERKYNEAREYWNGLDFEEKRYITHRDEYSRWLRPLKMSSL